MFELDNEIEAIDKAIISSEKNILILLACKDIMNEESLIKDWEKQLSLSAINLGSYLSQKLTSINDKRYITLEIEEVLNELVDKYKKVHLKKELLFLYNTGILLEPELKLALPTLFNKIIKHTNLILLWSGFIDTVNNKLFLLEKNSSYYVQLNEMEIYVCK